MASRKSSLAESAGSRGQPVVTMADALLLFQHRFTVLHHHSILRHLPTDAFERGRKLMVWIADRCDIPMFAEVPVTQQVRHQIDEFPMNDYGVAVEYGENLIRLIETDSGYGRRNSEQYESGLAIALDGGEYNPEYLPDIDHRSQRVRYADGGFEYYQGFREGRRRLAAHVIRMHKSRITQSTRSRA